MVPAVWAPIGEPLESAKPIFDVRAGGNPDDAGSDRAHHLAGADVRADRQLVERTGVAVVDVAVAGDRAVAVEHGRPWAEAADAV